MGKGPKKQEGGQPRSEEGMAERRYQQPKAAGFRSEGVVQFAALASEFEEEATTIGGEQAAHSSALTTEHAGHDGEIILAAVQVLDDIGVCPQGVRHDDKSGVEQWEAGHDWHGRQFGWIGQRESHGFLASRRDIGGC